MSVRNDGPRWFKEYPGQLELGNFCRISYLFQTKHLRDVVWTFSSLFRLSTWSLRFWEPALPGYRLAVLQPAKLDILDFVCNRILLSNSVNCRYLRTLFDSIIRATQTQAQCAWAASNNGGEQAAASGFRCRRVVPSPSPWVLWSVLYRAEASSSPTTFCAHKRVIS